MGIRLMAGNTAICQDVRRRDSIVMSRDTCDGLGYCIIFIKGKKKHVDIKIEKKMFYIISLYIRIFDDYFLMI